MYDYDEYMHDRGMYLDVATLPFRKIYDEKELAMVLSDESFMSDSYTDTEYFKTFFKYDAPDISQRLLDLLFTGESDSLEIKDYSFNKKKGTRLFTLKLLRNMLILIQFQKLQKTIQLFALKRNGLRVRLVLRFMIISMICSNMLLSQ